HRHFDFLPCFAGVLAAQQEAVVPHGPAVVADNPHMIQRRGEPLRGFDFLSMPTYTAVSSAQQDGVQSDGPSVLLVCKGNTEESGFQRTRLLLPGGTTIARRQDHPELAGHPGMVWVCEGGAVQQDVPGIDHVGDVWRELDVMGEGYLGPGSAAVVGA